MPIGFTVSQTLETANKRAGIGIPRLVGNIGNSDLRIRQVLLDPDGYGILPQAAEGGIQLLHTPVHSTAAHTHRPAFSLSITFLVDTQCLVEIRSVSVKPSPSKHHNPTD